MDTTGKAQTALTDNLIARLEAANFDTPIPRGGDTPRALDFAIHVAIGWVDHDQGGWWRGDEHTGPDWPHYTTSLDAALTLIPEETPDYRWGWTIHCADIGGMPRAQVWHRHGDESALGPQSDVPICVGATPALALCIAALKAKRLTKLAPASRAESIRSDQPA